MISNVSFRQSSESGGPLPSDPDCACKENKECSCVPAGEVSVHLAAGHKHPQGQSDYSDGKH